MADGALALDQAFKLLWIMMFGLFRCASAKSETTFADHFSILFHKFVLRFQCCVVV